MRLFVRVQAYLGGAYRRRAAGGVRGPHADAPSQEGTGVRARGMTKAGWPYADQGQRDGGVGPGLQPETLTQWYQVRF